MTHPWPDVPVFLAQAGDAPVSDPAAPITSTDDGTTPAADGSTTAPGGNGAPPPGMGSGFIWIMVLVLVVMWVFLLSGNRKQKKKREQMLSTLSKGQRVQTIGGILGSIVEVRDQEVVVKVDENANTRLRFAPSAIQTVLEDGSKSEETTK